jgi:hypothetical protein
MTNTDRSVNVEEEWGRRKIYEPLSNAERLEHYESKKALWRCFPVEVSPLRGAEVSAEVVPFPTRAKT